MSKSRTQVSQELESTGLLEVGYVAKAHGVRGELLIRSHWDGSEALEDCPVVWLRRDKRPDESRRVLGRRKTPKGHLVWLEGVAGRDQAELLRGSTVWLPRETLEPLDEGEYYLADLIGAEVVAPTGRVGVVERIAQYPSIDALVIRDDSGGFQEQPLLDEWLLEVDVSGKLIKLRSLEGLI